MINLLVLLVPATWLACNLYYGTIYGHTLRWPYFWGAHGALLFGMRLQNWESVSSWPGKYARWMVWDVPTLDIPGIQSRPVRYTLTKRGAHKTMARLNLLHANCNTDCSLLWRYEVSPYNGE